MSDDVGCALSIIPFGVHTSEVTKTTFLIVILNMHIILDTFV